MSSPLPFAPPALHDATAVRHAVGSARQSDLAFANMYLLRHKYGTEVALEEGFLFRFFGGHGRLQGYAFPRGEGDVVSALHRVEEDAACHGRPLRFCLLMEQEVAMLEAVYPGRFRFSSDPGDADYLYERRALAELPGARFHRKRNHLARFRRDFPHWSLAPLTRGNAHEALEVAEAWLAGAQGNVPSPALLHEYEAIAHALECLESLSLLGAVLSVNGRPVAMAVASMISPLVADVHYEKCLPEMRLAYPAINQGLAEMLDGSFINREEDLNHEGLRRAKLSYFPAQVLSKFSAV